MKAMIEDLKDFPFRDVQSAFVSWRRQSTKIPTPAAIIKLCKEYENQRVNRSGLQKRYVDFNGDWPAYCQYLFDRGQLHPDINPATGRMDKSS
jgi:hypothetical protein